MKIRKFNNRKGFTLVECIIAIAVFAVLTTMILMVISQAVMTQRRANEEEEKLNDLVDNVVNDQSQKRYGEYDSSKLDLTFTGNGKTANYSVTYNTVDGYKNYIKCPGCEKQFNNIEFMMDSVYKSDDYKTASAEDKAKFRLSYWFDPSNMNFVCPDCGKTFSAGSVMLICQSCETRDTITSGKFTYERETGNYICKTCQSGNIVQAVDDGAGHYVPITDNVTADAAFGVSGMAPNAIRYSNLKEPTSDDKLSLIMVGGRAFDDAELKYSANLTADYSNPSKPVKYTLTVKTNFTREDSEGNTNGPAELNITLPGSYILNITDVSDSLSGLDGKAEYTVPPNSNYMNSENSNVIKISKITYDGSGNDFWIEFTLTNYVNDNSFDYDYVTEGGLATFWFGENHTYSATATSYSVDLSFDLKNTSITRVQSSEFSHPDKTGDSSSGS